MDSKLSSAAAFVEGDVQDACDDTRSICLKPFCDSNPSTVCIRGALTSCKHDYHLQCILLNECWNEFSVNLWLAKIGSDDSGPESPSGSPNMQDEPLLNSYTDYEDSIYGIAWSSHDPYFFASLSYDGRVVLEPVKPYMQRK